MSFSQGISTESVQKLNSNNSINADEDISIVNAVYKKKKIKVKVKIIVKRWYYSETLGKWTYKNVTRYKYVTRYKKVKSSSKAYSSKVGASSIIVDSEYLESQGRCSCSLHKDYKEHYSKFKNYCPYCKKHGTLVYEEGRSCPEGMWVCSSCDADYCLVHGKSHTSKAKYLKKVKSKK
ncbi:hypothetical protein [Methanobacterium alcaliphilum]|uniref:hypothetical protein n=1 Tax=Methanobacterium alcaliphilum TaxID=392018 RepID=UPI002009EE96|nr:hypothetical protein [Methanobacterium alcaliphilum]MCK9151171.1 hypothetical protein [Methanobacterium alcaliphilum]